MAPRSFFTAAKKGPQVRRADPQGARVALDGRLQAPQGLLSIREPLLTTEDVMGRLGLGSVNAVYRMVRDFGLPRRRVGGVFRFVPSEVEAWLERQNAPAIAAARSAR
jgi:excisionase family DNA binding protein